MAKLKIKFHPLFWIFIVFLLFSNNFLSLFSYILCVFLHELGHAFTANLLGYKLNQITFLPFGASLSGKENVFYKPKHEILVAISGPLVNLIFVVISLALFWTLPESYFFLENFYFANLITFFFNLFPVYPLDGGRVFYAILKTKKPAKKSYKIVKIVGIIFSGLLFVLFVISSFYKINFTLGLSSLFLLSGVFFEDKGSFYVTNFSLINKSKKLSLGLETNVLSINGEASLYYLLRKLSKYKYNIVYVILDNGKNIKILYEEQINSLFLEHSLNETIKNIIK